MTIRIRSQAPTPSSQAARIFRPVLLLAAASLGLDAQGVVSLEATAWQSRLNEVRRPNPGGTTFSLLDLVGKGPSWAPRVDIAWELNERHGLRILLAPLEVTGTGQFREPVQYKNTEFEPGKDVQGRYRFNSWRATWRYTLHEGNGWTFRLGATGKIRDAKVQLTQGTRQETDTDLGFVPLAHVQIQKRLGPSIHVLFETDALGAKQGRAVDAALMVRWQATPRIALDAGYRLLEGGADNDRLYTWARLDGFRIGAAYRF